MPSRVFAGRYEKLSIGFSILALAGICFFAAKSAPQEVYQWTDEKGSIHFTDNWHQVPEKYRDKAQKKTLTVPRSGPSAGGGAAPQARTGQPAVVPFTREGNHIVVEASVNGASPIKLILDTGAELSKIPLAQATRLGIDVGRGLLIPVAGIGGVVTVPLVEIQSLRIGDAEVRDLEVTLQDLPTLGDKGLLGADFLGEYQVNIDYARNRVTFQPHPGSLGGRPLRWWQQKFRLYRSLKNEYEKMRSASREQGNVLAERLLATVNDKLNDLEIKASRAGIPREFRE
jgi:hypothetical protein